VGFIDNRYRTNSYRRFDKVYNLIFYLFTVKHQTKVLLKTFGIILGVSVVFLLGVATASEENEQPDCPECEICQEREACEPEVITKEVEKVVYKDSPETLQELKNHKEHACAFAYVIPALADLADASADFLGQARVPEMREYKSLSQNYYYSYCE
jgi:hypothetical protein